jgi:hypothetical protein
MGPAEVPHRRLQFAECEQFGEEIFTKRVDASGWSLNNSASCFTASMPRHRGDEEKRFSVRP